MGSPKKVITDQQCIRIVKGVQPAEVVALIGDPAVRHVIQEDGWDFQSELEAAKIMIERPESFISNPLSVILGRPQLAPGQSFSISSQVDEKKTNTLFQFELFLTSLTGSRSIADQAMMIADEFFTNATKASKITDSEKNLSSGENTEAANVRKVDFFSGTFGGRLVIGCRDPFGKLEVSTIIERLTSCYQKGVAQSIRHGSGGAGIGTFMVFDACISYYAIVHKNHASVVCAVLPLSSKRKDAEGLSKNIHLTELNKTANAEVIMSSSAGFSFKQKADGTTLHLSLTGTIDEDAQMPPVAAGTFKNVLIDMSEIKSINSIGIREWLKWIQPIAESAKITFEKCPKSIVLQFNMVEGFLPASATVVSFFVPYFCESCDREDNHLFTVGKDISVKAGNVSVTFDLSSNGKCAKSPCASEMDVSAAKYFQFLKKLA